MPEWCSANGRISSKILKIMTFMFMSSDSARLIWKPLILAYSHVEKLRDTVYNNSVEMRFIIQHFDDVIL